MIFTQVTICINTGTAGKLYNLGRRDYDSENKLYDKGNENQLNSTSSNKLNSLIDTLTNQVFEIIKGINPFGRIRIPKDWLIPYFKDRKEMEEGLLIKVYSRVSKTTDIDVDVIQQLMRDRVEIV